MTITRVASQGGGATFTNTANANTVERAFPGNVTAGNLVYAIAAKYDPLPLAFDASQLTVKAGSTATLGTISMHIAKAISTDLNQNIAVWSAIVTGTGSLTLALTSSQFSYVVFGTDELNSDVGWDSSREEATNTGEGNSNSQVTGDMTSAGGSVFLGGFAIEASTNDTSLTEQAAFTRLYRETDGSATEVGILMLRIVSSGTTDAIESSTTGGPWIYGGAGAVLKEIAAAGTTVTPGAGALVLAGAAPTVVRTTNALVQPGAGALSLVGLEPQLLKHLFTVGDTGVLSYVGGDALVGGLEPPQVIVVAPINDGVLVLNGLTPTIVVTTGSNVTVTPGAGALVLAGLAPTAHLDMFATPSAGALVLAGQAPTVLQDQIVQPGAGALVLAGLAPVTVQNQIVQPGAGALVLDGQVPAVLNGDVHVVQPGAGALVLAGAAPTVLADITASPSAGALVLAGAAPTVGVSVLAQPGAGALVLAGAAPVLSVSANVIANPLTGALILTGLTPTAAVSDNQVVQPGTGALVLAGVAPTIPIPSPTVVPDPGALFLEGLAPGIVVTGDDVLSAKFLGRPNVNIKGLGGKKRKEEPAEPPAPEITNMPGTAPVVKKAQGLNLGLITVPPAPAPAAPAFEVPAIAVTMPDAPAPAPAKPASAAPSPPPEPPAPPPPVATQADVAALHKAILEATTTEVGAQTDRVLMVLASVLEKVDDLQAKIESDTKARDLRERNMLRAKQIAERMLKDLEK